MNSPHITSAPETLRGSNVCIICDNNSSSSATIQTITNNLKIAKSKVIFFDEMEPGAVRLAAILKNIQESDIIIICSNADFMAYETGSTIDMVLGTVISSGKPVFELPISRYSGCETSQFGGLLVLDILHNNNGALGAEKSIEKIELSLQSKSRNKRPTLQSIATTLQSALENTHITNEVKKRQNLNTQSLRVSYIFDLVLDYIRNNRFIELNKGITIPSDQGLFDAQSINELQAELHKAFGVSIEYDTGFSPDRSSSGSHRITISGGAVEDGLQVIRNTQIRTIRDGISALISKVSQLLERGGYTIPKHQLLDSIGQRQLEQFFAEQGLTVEYVVDSGMYYESSPMSKTKHLIKFDASSLQKRLIYALAEQITNHIVQSGKNVGPWTIMNEAILGANHQISIDLLQGVKILLERRIDIQQRKQFYTPYKHYLEISAVS